MKRNILLLGVVVIFGACTAQRQTRLFNLAEEKIEGGSYFEGADALRRGIALNPQSTMALKAIYRLGLLQEIYIRDYEAALNSYKEYLTIAKDYVGLYEVQKRVANIYFDHFQDPEKAILTYRRLLELQPDSLEKDQFQYRVGRSYFLQNNFSDSRSAYQELVDGMSRSELVPKARFEIGNTYFMEGKFDLAVEVFKQVLRFHAQHPQAIEAQFWIAQSYEQLGDLKQAQLYYEQLRLKYPTPGVIEKRLTDLKARVKRGG